MAQRTRRIFQIFLTSLIFLGLSHTAFSNFISPTYLFQHATYAKRNVRSMRLRHKITFPGSEDFCYQTLFYAKPGNFRVEIECEEDKSVLTSSEEMKFPLWSLLLSSSQKQVLTHLENKNIVETLSGRIPLPVFKMEKILLKKKPDEEGEELENLRPEKVVYIDKIENKKITLARAELRPVKYEDSFALKIFNTKHDQSYILMDQTNRKELNDRLYSAPRILRWMDEDENLYQVKFEDYELVKGTVRIPKKITLSEIERKELEDEEGFEEVEEILAEITLQETPLLNLKISDDFFEPKDNDKVSNNDMEKLIDLCYR